MTIRLLRGVVVVREEREAATAEYTHLILPSSKDTDRKFHVGRVLAMGAPALTKRGVEVPHGFEVGDRVCFHFEHYEKNATRPWVDGEDAVWLPQVCVDAVVAA